MASRHDSHFQPPPPIRTSTTNSQRSQSSGTMSPSSDMLSPTSTGPRSAASPAEGSFFGAITSRIRGRSRSRPRAGGSGKRSKSPIVMPPEQFPPTSSAHAMNPTYGPQRSQQSRHVSAGSHSSTASTSTKATRASIHGPARRSTTGSDPWHGRHSNSWLFNDFSVREHAKDLLHMGRKS